MSSINRYTYEQISIGQKTSFSIVITDEMMVDFYSITGDCNPLHVDEEFVRFSGGGYTGRVVYGMLSASFLSTLAGVYLPGENSVIRDVDVKFPAPVYIGDTLTFTGEVIQKYDIYNIIELKVSAVNSCGKKVIRGKMKVVVLK